MLDGYFGAARRAIEGHGGTIEKFIGDAVMAIFGVPVAHEDDALRAVRAAADTRAAVAALGEAVEREHGLRLDLRIDQHGRRLRRRPWSGGLVTGNAVNVARRIEQAAPSGSIMLGAAALELVRDAVRVRAVKPSRKAMPAFRLSASSSRASRASGGPLSGRSSSAARTSFGGCSTSSRKRSASRPPRS